MTYGELSESQARRSRQFAEAQTNVMSVYCDAERDLKELQAENAKLREELADAPKCETCEAMLDCDECLRADGSHKERRRLSAENAKLRELAERAWKTAERLCQAFEGPCRDDGVTITKPCPMGERDEECVYGQLQRDLRELEVDE